MRKERKAKEHSVLKGYYYIPGFSNYVISKDGVVINVSRPDKKLLGYKKPRGYVSLSLVDDNGKKRGIGVHRAIAQTFLECPGDLSDYVPNHIDENPSNNTLDNIEWLLPKQNTQHSIQRVRERRKLPVDVRDVNTLEVRHYESVSVCAKAFQTHPSTIRSRIELVPGSVFDGYQFKYHEDKWITPKDVSVRKAVVLKQLIDNKFIIFEDQRSCARYLKLCEATLSGYLLKSDKRILPGYYVARRMGDDSWPVYNDPIKEFAMNGVSDKGYGKGVQVTNTVTGEVAYYPNIKDAAIANGLKHTTLHQRLKSGSGKVYKDMKQYAYL